MRINHNIASLNTYRQLTTNTTAGSKSLEKLSSGLRINRAGDDAAGLAISEKMRGQIRGLDQASRNAQDGISLIQTAEGALNETHSILQRMRELAVQSATDTNTATDRSKIQAEVDQLAKEITRISNTTEFNTKNLLAGGLKNNVFHIGANSAQNVSLTIGAMDAKSLGVAGDFVTTTATNGSELGTNFVVTTSSEGINGYFVNVAKVAATQTVSVAGGTDDTTA
ncbi:MAG: flagellin, partial [Clostridiaceae bacterium]|nr:flagellin [Clostridiaceae bacterium]